MLYCTVVVNKDSQFVQRTMMSRPSLNTPFPGCDPCEGPEPLRSLRAPTYSFNHPTVQRIKLGAVKSDLFHPCLPSWKRYEMDTVSGKPPEEHSQNSTTICLGASSLRFHRSVNFRGARHYCAKILCMTRKLCYRKDDRAMRPIHGALKIFGTP